MTSLIDTHWVASYLNGRREAVLCVDGLVAQGAVMRIISYGEILEGLFGLPDPAIQVSHVQAFVAGVTVIPPDRDIARQYAQQRSQLRAIGQLIPDNDLWIAATALARDLVLVSRDHHFDRIPGLRR